jgi:phage recombination protein Bet
MPKKQAVKASPSEFTQEYKDLIRTALPRDVTNDEVRLFLYQCQRTGLDPLTRQIYAVRRWSTAQKKYTITIQVSIDGFRLVAERTGNYGGQTTPEWCASDGIWKDVWVPEAPPIAARVGVWRINFKEPTYGVAKFKSYAVLTKEGKLNEFWSKMPEVMIAKVAEALALRKAFPQELSGLYTSEEMEQANEQSIMDRQASREAAAVEVKEALHGQDLAEHGGVPTPPGVVPVESDIDQINLELAMKGKNK